MEWNGWIIEKKIETKKRAGMNQELKKRRKNHEQELKANPESQNHQSIGNFRISETREIKFFSNIKMFYRNF